MLVGANPDELDQTATQLAASADKVKGIHAEALGMIRQSPWAGTDAEHYEELWRTGARARLDEAAQLLHDAADALRRNAAEQRKTSEADADGFGSISGVVHGAPIILPPFQGPRLPFNPTSLLSPGIDVWKIFKGITTGPSTGIMRFLPYVSSAFSGFHLWQDFTGPPNPDPLHGLIHNLGDAVGLVPIPQVAGISATINLAESFQTSAWFQQHVQPFFNPANQWWQSNIGTPDDMSRGWSLLTSNPGQFFGSIPNSDLGRGAGVVVHDITSAPGAVADAAGGGWHNITSGRMPWDSGN